MGAGAPAGPGTDVSGQEGRGRPLFADGRMTGEDETLPSHVTETALNAS